MELFDKLSTGLYREVVHSPAGCNLLPLVKAVCRAFTDLQELRYLPGKRAWVLQRSLVCSEKHAC